MAGYYKDLATGIILLSVGFCLGTIYSNWTFDYHLLWESPTSEKWVELALEYYKLKAEQSNALHHVLHFFIAIGFFGIFVKLYKPTESNTLFDGGSLVLYFIATVIYITNMRPASYSLITGNWGDIDGFDGVRLIAAAQVLIVLALIGLVAMQAGQWWAFPKEFTQQRSAFEEKERVLASGKPADPQETPTPTADTTAPEAVPSSAETSGSSAKKAKKRK